MSAVQFSRYTSKAGVLSKRITLDGGALKKDPAAQLSNGTVEVLEMNHVGELADVIAELTTNQALGLGVPVALNGSTGTLEIRTTRNKEVDGDKVIARSKQHMDWPRPPSAAVVLLDYDGKGENVTHVEDVQKMRDILGAIDKQWHTLDVLRTHSTSSGLYAGEKCMSPEGGLHIYAAVDNPSQLPTYMRALYMHAFISSGWIMISRSGVMLERTVFDASVVSPERLIFEAGALLGTGLVQKRPAPQYEPRGLARLDASKLRVTQKLESDYRKAVKAKRAEVQAQCDRIRKAYLGKEATKLSKATGMTVKQARVIVKARSRQVLYGDDLLYPRDGEPFTVRDVLDSPEKYHHMYLHCPREPEEGSNRARIYVDAKHVVVRSFLHGGCEFKLSEASTPAEAMRLDDLLPANIDRLDKVLGDPKIGVFHRGAMLVRVTQERSEKLPTWVKRDPKQPMTQLLKPSSRLVETATRNIDVTAFVDGEEKRVDLPGSLARAFVERGVWQHVNSLRGTATWPVPLPTGDVLYKAGYDPESGILTRGSYELPVKGTRKAAMAALDEVIKDFPFVDATSRSVALSLMFTLMLRPTLSTAPLHAISATVRGTGKSLLCEAITEMVTGHIAATYTLSPSDEENEKRISTAIVVGDPVINLDNITEALGGSTLCVAMTSPEVSIRPFGSNTESLLIPNTATWIATGNNLAITGDMTRRSLVCEMDAGTERPEHREGFAHPELRAWVEQERPRLLAAMLTLVREFHEAGSPPSGRPPLGSFEEWSRRVRDMLIWLGEEDPAASQVKLEDDDPVRNERLAVFVALAEVTKNQPFTVADLRNKFGINESEYFFSAEGAPPEKVAMADHKEVLRAVRDIGKFLRQNKGGITQGIRIVSLGKARGGLVKWAVQRV